MNILEVSNISKSFGSSKILDGLSFLVKEHSVYGFIGHNGAGKTTTMKIILGLLKADSGEIRVNNEKVIYGQNKTNKFIGYLPDVPEYYNYMTPYEYLRLCGEITGMDSKSIKSRSEELLQMVGLDKSNKKIKGFSRGMKQRLGIAQALVNSPKLLICDEPTSALDPAGRKEILDILYCAREYTTVMFSTHILSDVERICDEIAFLHKGKTVLSGSINQIKEMRPGDRLEIEFMNPNDTLRFKDAFNGAELITENKLHYLNITEKDIKEIMQYLISKDIPITKLERLEPTLEELFLEVTSK